MVAPVGNLNAQDELATLGSNGQPPESRMSSAEGCVDYVNKLVRDDQTRSRKRALVQGIVDGNPPYQRDRLVKAGRSSDCNVNWRIAESYLGAALGAFYDIFSEAPTYATVTLTDENPEKAAEYSQIVTEEFDRLQRRESGFDFNMRLSQHEMVLFGVGPLIFPDREDWRPQAARTKELLVPENAKGNTHDWEIAVWLCTYSPDRLYGFIRNEKAAKDIGWNVEATRQAIMEAHPKYQDGGAFLNWEWHQQQLKNGSFNYSALSKAIFTGHLFVKEFPKEGETEGKISHKIVLVSPAASTGTAKFLYEKIGKFDNWDECIHPMYYDIGSGGEHHAVTGMGVKMYSAMEYQNRLLCNLADKAFAPKVLFKPTTASAKETVSVGNLSEWGVMPAGYDVQQTGIAGMLDDGIAFNREVSGIISSNLSQYRQNLQREQGNPVTAREIDWRSSEQARLGKTQLNRAYEQMDGVYAEKYRRASSAKITKMSPGGAEALEFQERCKKRGVPAECLRKIEHVKATRIVGQGSVFERRQALEFLLGMIAMLPESGRDNVIKDAIASRAGQSMVGRYYPTNPENQRPTDQHAFAMSQVADMKVGVAPVITSTQNPVIYAQTFIQAAAQAIESVQAGGNPVEVLSFLEIAGPAIAAHLQRMQGDRSREGALKVLTEQWKKIGSLTDQLRKMIERQQEQAAQQQEQAASQMGDAAIDSQLKVADAQQDMQIKEAKAQQLLRQKDQKFRQQLAIKDVTTAVDIQNQQQRAEQEHASVPE